MIATVPYMASCGDRLRCVSSRKAKFVATFTAMFIVLRT